ncbi:MAG: response regulator [Pseudomonadota bacterium]
MSPDLRILVVDDFSTMRRIIANLLGELGFTEITLAASASEARQILNREPFDLVVSDWNMPEMTGLDLLKAIRADAQLKMLPVLLVTAEAKKQQILDAAHAGVNGYIIKPFSAEILDEKIRRIFKRIEDVA